MPRRRLEYAPGVTSSATADAARGTWWQSNLIRFFVDPATKRVFPQKIGGWRRIANAFVIGACRCINYWTDLSKLNWFGAGTNQFLYVENGGTLFNITPLAFVPGLASSPPNPLFSLLVWSLDNYGELLVACPSGDTIYSWTPPNTGVPAAVLAGSPPHNQGIFVSNQIQILIAFGSSPNAGAIDPMLMRWCAQSDFNDWTASTTNQAGSYRLPRGSRIIGALSSLVGNLIWTDLDLWSMQYLGFPLVFGFTQTGRNCGLIAQNARAVLYGVVYWMSDHNFFSYGPGGVQIIPCSVWDTVFDDLDKENQDKCWAATNAPFNEIWFFYPSASGTSGEIDKYVKYNVVAQVWDYGDLGRTAGTDDNKPGGPVWVDLEGLLQEHEVGTNADGDPMVGVRLRSGMIDIDDGEYLASFTEFIPDFDWDDSGPGASIVMNFYIEDMPQDAPTMAGGITITPDTRYENPRGRGIGIAVEVVCNAADTFWRWGSPRLKYNRSGKVS